MYQIFICMKVFTRINPPSGRYCLFLISACCCCRCCKSGRRALQSRENSDWELEDEQVLLFFSPKSLSAESFDCCIHDRAILSRFDVIFILLDTPDRTRDQLLSEHVMALHSSRGSAAARDRHRSKSVSQRSHTSGECDEDSLLMRLQVFWYFRPQVLLSI